jgi:3-dehydroquinate synthase
MDLFIHVDIPQQSYDIAIAANNLDKMGQLMTSQKLGNENNPDNLSQETTSLKLGNKVLVVSNPTIFRHYGQRAIASLKSAGFEVAKCELSDGEAYKTLDSIQKIYDAALEHQLERSSTLVALGGGVIGDMTGFAAATWLRGINFVQVPTTLLAMVDAAIGGKTGVNHPKGKNLIGAFHQPRLVVIDPQVLNTLPPREFRAGMAEVIKYGVIWDAELFVQMEQCDRLDQLCYLDEGLLQQILMRSAQAKANVVSKDEKEAGLREILNYGHTIGHAVESLTGYRLVNHGEAVAIGMVAAGQLAVNLNVDLKSRQQAAQEDQFEFWQQEEQERQLALIKKAGLDPQLPAGIDIEKILETLQTDKKVKAGRVRFVLPTQIGAAKVTAQVQPDQIRQVLQQMQSK